MTYLEFQRLCIFLFPPDFFLLTVFLRSIVGHGEEDLTDLDEAGVLVEQRVDVRNTVLHAHARLLLCGKLVLEVLNTEEQTTESVQLLLIRPRHDRIFNIFGLNAIAHFRV